jgi:hypothetical protein
MAKQVQVVGAVLALALSLPVFSQTPPALAAEQPLVVPASATVQQLAPQLVNFAGSASNFQSLVNGLALGLPVTLVTLTADGFTQTVTFTAAGAMTPVDIATTLEIARQNLIARGIAAPTAQQLGVTLAGGTLPTALAAVPVTGLIPVGASASAAISASAGSSARAMPLAAASSGLIIQITPTPGQLQPGTAVTAAPVPRFTSDSPFLRNTSDSPLSAVPTSASPSLSTSTSPSFNTSNSPVLVPSAGGPSPAVQLQIRR